MNSVSLQKFIDCSSIWTRLIY